MNYHYCVKRGSEILVRICKYLNCTFDDVIEIRYIEPQSRLNRIDRKDEYIANDLFYESSTIYQENSCIG